MTVNHSVASVENAAEAYLQLFEHHDIEYFFNSPGSEDSALWEAFSRREAQSSGVNNDELEYVNCRHESVAVGMAKGYTMMTGDPQIVKLHVNTGPLHGAMELYGVNHSAVPMLVLSSYNSTHEGELEGGTAGAHYLDFQQPGGHENNVSRYTKWVTDIKTNENAERILARSLRIANSPPKGPVFVNAAEELLQDSTKDHVTLVDNPSATPRAPDAAILDELVTKLEAADNPLIITGRTGEDPGAVEHLVSLAETLQIPVFENQKWRFNFPMDHPLYLGASAGSGVTAQPLFDQDIDVVFVVDSTKPWYPPEKGAPTDTEILWLNSEPVQEKKAYWNYPANLLITGDSKRVLATLADRVSPRETPRPIDWHQLHDRWERRWSERAREGDEASPIDPFWLCYKLDELLSDDAILCNETVTHGTVISNLIKDRDDRTFISALKSSGGGLGTGISVTLGAKLAEPDRLAVALLGDGGYSYNPVTAACGAAQEHNLPILMILFNNESYRSMRASLETSYPDGWAVENESYVGSEISPTPNYAEQARALGGIGETVVNPDEIQSAVNNAVQAVEDGRVALLDIHLDDSMPGSPDIYA